LSDAAMDQLRAAYETCDYSSGKLKSLNLPVSYPPSGPYFKNRVLMENGNTFEFTFDVSATQISSSKAGSNEWVTSSIAMSFVQIRIDNPSVIVEYIDAKNERIHNNPSICSSINGGYKCKINSNTAGTWKMGVRSTRNRGEIYNITLEFR
ncbi:hypothetical protein WDW89_15605, partial [Deltaproteobacteria bacterium TL4]